MNHKNNFSKMLIFCIVIVFVIQNANIHLAYSSKSRSITVYEMKGNVTIRKKGREKQTGAFIGMRLSKGDIINTSAESSVALDLDGTKVIIIAEETEATISDENGTAGTDDSTVISLAKGSFFVSIKEKLAENAEFNVVTSNAVLAVRGTAFALAILPSLTAKSTNELCVYSFSGMVSVNVTKVDPGGTLIDSGACELLPNTMLNTELVKPGESIVKEEINLDRMPLAIAESILTIEDIEPALLSVAESRIEQIKAENLEAGRLKAVNPEMNQVIPEESKAPKKEENKSPASTPVPTPVPTPTPTITSGQALIVSHYSF